MRRPYRGGVLQHDACACPIPVKVHAAAPVGATAAEVALRVVLTDASGQTLLATGSR